MNDPRYHSSRWRRLRIMQLKAYPQCFYCAQLGRLTLATTVDHIVPVHRGGDFWALENLRSACESCNYSKRDRLEEDFVAKGCDVNGLPLSPNHPWNKER